MNPSVNDALQELLGAIIDYGTECAPRGKPVREIVGHSVKFNMMFPLVTLKARNLGYRFAPAEAAWILSGDNRVENITRYSPFIWEFSDDGIFYQGAYGPKVVDQMSYVCDALANDPDSRQAVMNIWRENPRPTRDFPCTLSYQFLVRDHRLHVVQTMRSSDAWLGYSYDAFNATMLAGYVFLCLRDRQSKKLVLDGLGSHTMMIGSSHLYEKNIEAAQRVCDNHDEVFPLEAFDPNEFISPSHIIQHLQSLAAGELEKCSAKYLTQPLASLPRK